MKLRGFLAAVVIAGMAGAAHAQNDEAAFEDEIVILTVNSQQIYASDIVMLHESLPAQYQQLPMEMFYPQLLNTLIDRKLMVEKARILGLADGEAVQRRIAFHEESVLEEIYLAYVVDEKLTQERLQAAYDELVSSWQPEEQVRAKHILLETVAEAQAVIAELDGGADFAELARTRSIGPSSVDGGDLGYFRRQGDMIPAFADAAFALEPGDVTPTPIETSFGWHVIRVEDRRMSPPPGFDEVSDQLHDQEAEKVILELSETLREGAKIESPGE